MFEEKEDKDIKINEIFGYKPKKKKEEFEPPKDSESGQTKSEE